MHNVVPFGNPKVNPRIRALLLQAKRIKYRNHKRIEEHIARILEELEKIKNGDILNESERETIEKIEQTLELNPVKDRMTNRIRLYIRRLKKIESTLEFGQIEDISAILNIFREENAQNKLPKSIIEILNMVAEHYSLMKFETGKEENIRNKNIENLKIRIKAILERKKLLAIKKTKYYLFILKRRLYISKEIIRRFLIEVLNYPKIISDENGRVLANFALIYTEYFETGSETTRQVKKYIKERIEEDPELFFKTVYKKSTQNARKLIKNVVGADLPNKNKIEEKINSMPIDKITRISFDIIYLEPEDIINAHSTSLLNIINAIISRLNKAYNYQGYVKALEKKKKLINRYLETIKTEAKVIPLSKAA